MSNYIENILQDEDEDFENFRSIIGKIESPKNEAVREKTIIPDDDVDKFLDKLVSEERYQQACAFALAAMSGARKSELLRFKVEYFDENNIVYGGLYKTPKIKTDLLEIPPCFQFALQPIHQMASRSTIETSKICLCCS